MTGYLQRLFDRGGGDVPAPAATSMSPVAQADQRLTVPGIGDALMWQPPVFGVEAEPSPEAIPFEGFNPPAPRSFAERPALRPDAPGRMERPLPLAPALKPESLEAPSPPEAQQPRPAPAHPSPIARIGAIDAGDLELPMSPESLPVTPEPQQERLPAMPVQERPVQPPVTGRARPDAHPTPVSPIPTEPARPAEPVGRDEPRPERDPAIARPAPLPEPEAPRLAEPVPPAPVAAVPVPNPEPPPLEVAPPPPVAPAPSAPRPEPRRVEAFRAPDAQKPPRPLTANEVSVIGPLPASRRSATFFGLRRR